MHICIKVVKKVHSYIPHSALICTTYQFLFYEMLFARPKKSFGCMNSVTRKSRNLSGILLPLLFLLVDVLVDHRLKRAKQSYVAGFLWQITYTVMCRNSDDAGLASNKPLYGLYAPITFMYMCLKSLMAKCFTKCRCIWTNQELGSVSTGYDWTTQIAVCQKKALHLYCTLKIF